VLKRLCIPKLTLKLSILSSLLILLLSYSLLVSSEESKKNWYQIEYIIFEHKNADRHVLRFEDTSFKLPKRRQYLHLLDSGEPISPFQLKQVNTDATLESALKKLVKSPRVNVLDRGAWQQEIGRSEVLPPLKIAVDLRPDQSQQLLGEIQIVRERYMHAKANIYMTEWIQLPYPDLKDWLFQEPTESWPFSWLLQPIAYRHTTLTRVGESKIPKNVVHLEQSRRIKGSEIHYMDHPVLGVMITIKEIEPPFEFGDESDI